jgi:hypothetical protein
VGRECERREPFERLGSCAGEEHRWYYIPASVWVEIKRGRGLLFTFFCFCSLAGLASFVVGWLGERSWTERLREVEAVSDTDTVTLELKLVASFAVVVSSKVTDVLSTVSVTPGWGVSVVESGMSVAWWW